MKEGVRDIVNGNVLMLRSERLIQQGRDEGRNEGLNEGRMEGRIISCAEDVREGLLSLERAAKRLGLSPETFRSRAEELGYPIQENAS